MSSRRPKKRVQRRVRQRRVPSLMNQAPQETLIRNGGLPSRGLKAMKIFDGNLATYAPSTSGVVQALFQPSQGIALTQRIGDRCLLRGLYINYTLNAANADVFSSCRVIIFQWKVNAGLLAPTVAAILQLATDNVNAMYDFNYADQYIVLYDRLHSLAGTITNPTASSNQNWAGQVSLGRAMRKVDFSPSAITGSNQIYLLTISDSAIAPFPQLVFKSRVLFEDEY